jgi:hypothetical protein
MFSIDSRDFLNNPLSFAFNIAKQIWLFLHVFDFQGPSERQTYPIFLLRNFLANRRPWEEEVNRERDKVEKRVHHVGLVPGHVVGPNFPIVHPFNAILDSTDSSWPKINYIKEPTSGFPESLIITLSHPCGKTSLAASLCAWSHNEWHFEE